MTSQPQRSHEWLLRISATALLAGALPAPATAQQVPIVQAGAGGRYETQIDPKTEAYGFSTAQVSAFRPKMEAIVEMFAAMSEVKSPPAPICHRLETWLENASPHGLLAGEVRVMSPITFENGRCHRMTGTGVKVRLNDLQLLADPQQAIVRTDGEGSDWFAMPYMEAVAKVVRFGDAIAFTHGRQPLFRTVSAERYLLELMRQAPADPPGGGAGVLARWLAEEKPRLESENAQQLREMAAFVNPADLAKIAQSLNDGLAIAERELRREAGTDHGPSERQRIDSQLAALSLAERAAAACIIPGSGALDSTPGCPEGLTIFELNPAYFDKSQPTAVQLLVIQTPAGRTHGENDQRLGARKAVWAALERERLAALVE